MQWIYIFIAGVLEIVWVLGLRFSNGFTVLVPSIITVVTLAISFYLFSKSLKYIPIGTAYAIFTGFGAAGTALVGILFFHESTSFSKLFFIGLMLAGIIGLKITTPDEKNVEEEGN
ncbi:Quaternary ammonium compound-resistance protein SugE [Bacillus sp. THAF10]|uniref:DMT family transporter n=1 Tax=Bacillus sp. THAF10 TaxID=2587848 RepID=UPI0012681242|nr:multidrug efflux SMR transporter [Bacillus sp. THAF10]QFT88207.1 Quaternary ammonium compound-resistance protein SugE [Bacillus sp. THAF10]